MNLHDYPETDSLYIDLAARLSSASREISDGLVVDYDDERRIVGLDIQHASEQLDLATLETEALPLAMVRSA